MASVASASRYVTLASHYPSRPSMYIRDLILRNWQRQLRLFIPMTHAVGKLKDACIVKEATSDLSRKNEFNSFTKQLPFSSKGTIILKL